MCWVKVISDNLILVFSVDVDSNGLKKKNQRKRKYCNKKSNCIWFSASLKIL